MRKYTRSEEKRGTPRDKQEGGMMSVTIDVIRGNSVYLRAAVVSEDTYRGGWEALMRGEEVPCEWGEDGTPVAWDVLSGEEE